MTPSDPSPAGLPPHLAALAPGDWAIWRWSCLRSAGFPLARLATLGNDSAVRAADQLIDARHAEQAAHRQAVATVRGCLDELTRTGTWDSAYRRPLLQAITALRKGKPVPAGLPPAAATATADLDRTRKASATAADALDRGWSQARARTSAAIADLAIDDRIAEAIVWQNREAFEYVLKPLRRDGVDGPHNKNRRRREEVVARYAQRYCAKNDSIGYFGPISWARFVDTGPALSMTHGPDLIRDRRTCCEQWAVDALAEAIGALPGARQWARPRWLPFAHRTGDTIQADGSRPIHLSPGQAAAVAVCDGHRSAREVATVALAAGDPALRDDNDVYAFLTDLTNRGFLEWRVEVPFVTAPQRELAALVDAIGDDRLRPVARRMLQVYETAIAGVTGAAGTVEPLSRSLEKAERIFTRLTSRPAVRGRGQMYAARAIVYEDCTRDLDVDLGPALRDELAAPLTLLLQSLRWLTAQVADRVHTELRNLVRELRSGSPEAYVPGPELWQALPRLFPGVSNERHLIAPFMTELRAEFQRRWQDLLGIGAADRVVRHHAASLRAAVARAFPADRPGWEFARYHSPDVLIAATDAAAIARGAYDLVLGEMHAGVNTVATARFADNHPTPHLLPEFVAWDLPGQAVATVTPRLWPGITSGTRDALRRPTDIQLLMSHEFADRSVPADSQVAISELILEDVGGSLRARTYDRRVDLPAVEIVGELLSISVVDAFNLSAGRRHTPRVHIDRLIVQRESWRLPLQELAPLTDGDEADRFAAVRQFAREHGLPERVFVKVPTEEKPFYVDFTSPILVSVIRKVLRRAINHGAPDATVTITEMLPDPAQAWLSDRDGHRYTSEFRTVIVDLAGRPGPAPGTEEPTDSR